MRKKKIAAALLAASAGTGVMAINTVVAHAAQMPRGKKAIVGVKQSESVNNNKNSNNGVVQKVIPDLRVRSGAGLKFSKIGKLYTGEKVTILKKVGDWYKISYNGKEGYSYGEFIDVQGMKSPNDNVVGKTGIVVNVSPDLRIRSGAGLNFSQIGRLYSGEEVNILGKVGDWYKIEYNGIIGYSYSEYINVGNANSNSNSNSNSTNTNTQNKVIKLIGNGTVVNAYGGLHFRQGPSLGSNIMGYLYNGNQVSIISKNGNWYKVRFNGQTGYVYGSFIQINNQSSNGNNQSTQSTQNVGKGYGQVINAPQGLHLRDGASLNSNIINCLNNGEGFKVLGQVGNWYKVNVNGQVGYVYSAYVQLTNSMPSGSSSNSNSSSSTQSVNQGYGEVINAPQGLNFRNGASLNSNVINCLNNGEGFKVLGQVGNWYKVNVNGQVGYVYSAYVQLTNSMPSGSSRNSNSNSSTQSVNQGYGEVINAPQGLHLRDGASLNSNIINCLNNGEGFKVLGQVGNWYKVNVNGQVGYVYSAYVQLTNSMPSGSSSNSNSSSSTQSVSQGYGEVVNAPQGLNFRNGASINSNVISCLNNGEGFKVLGQVGNWYKVNVNGQVGYVYSAYVQLTNSMPSNNGNDSNSSSSANLQGPHGVTVNATFSQIFNILKREVGSPYIWGGDGEYITQSMLNQMSADFPNAAAQGRYDIPQRYIGTGYRGFDCSGLMDWAFRQLGVYIGRTTYQQINAGYEVPLSQIKPGDLLFFKGDYHVGMYIGHGEWIVAPHSHAYVRISPVPWSYIGEARRILV